jgi:hypothetical protein
MIERQKKMMKERMGTIGDADKERIINEFELGFKNLSGSVQMERKRQFILMQEKRKRRRMAREKLYGEKDMKEIADEMGENLMSSDIKLMDSNSMMSKMLNSWKSKTEENYMLQRKVEEASRL